MPRDTANEGLMRDGYGRTINYLRLAITDRCNLRCGYCMPASGAVRQPPAALLSYQELLQVARVAVALGVRKIRLTGGEPLLRPGLVDFVAALTALSAAPEVTLTTNGLGLAEVATALRDAGLARVNVSLDSLRPERFRAITGGDGIERILAGIDAAQAAGLYPLKINMVPLRDINHDEIGDFARLAITRDCQIRFIEYMPVAAGQAYPADRCYPAVAVLADLATVGALQPVERQGPAGPARLYRFAGGRGWVGLIPAVSRHFCDRCNRLRITADGRIRPCLFSDEAIDLRGALRWGGDDAELAAILQRAALDKPGRHRLDAPDYRPGNHAMRVIGG